MHTHRSNVPLKVFAEAKLHTYTFILLYYMKQGHSGALLDTVQRCTIIHVAGITLTRSPGERLSWLSLVLV